MRLYRLLILALPCALVLVHPSAFAFEAGAAKVEITPPVGTPLNGYGARQARASVGVHDPVWARCLYLDDGQTDVFLVNTDLVYINPELRARVLELVPDGAVRERVILTATHTHYAQGAMNRKQPYRYVAGAFDAEILEKTASAIAQSMELARASKQRAAIGYGSIKQTDLTSNRRFKGGPVDEQIGFIVVENADGAPISVVANMAAHPTSVPDDYFYHVSADFPGFFYNELETLAGGSCVALFMNGAQGDQTIASPENTSGWERTEKVGKLLAQRVFEASQKTECREEALSVGYSEPVLPPTVANYIQPERTVLHTLEIGNLLITFFPGEPCVEIGLEMRRRAKETGYADGFAVALSNDYINYFVPPSLYDDLIYENAMNFFGPDIANFFYIEFARLMTRTPMGSEAPSPSVAVLDNVAGGRKLTLTGDSRTRGHQRGAALASDLAVRYQERILDAFVPGEILPDTAPYTLLPSFINPAAVGIVPLATSARVQLSTAADWQRDLVAGMATGAGMPFDALWLLQTATSLPLYEDKAPLFTAPLCTIFAVGGEQAAGGMLIGRNLDWKHKEWPLIIEESGPDTLRTIQVGFSWNTGAYTGMNEKGVVVALQRLPDAGPQPWGQTPLEFHLARVLAEAVDYPAALAILREVKAANGIVLIAGPGEKGFKAATLHYAGSPKITESTEGYLPGITGDEEHLDADTKSRYERAASMISESERVLPTDMMRVLSDGEGEGGGRIYNGETVHSVVFEPARGIVHVAFPEAGADAPRYTALSISGGSTGE